jgi:serine/threonine-protein kinase SMG1
LFFFSINRDDLYQQLLQMQNYLQKLETQRTAIQLSENHRNILSKQLILIQQAEALGSAMRSHPLNTLSQRYNTYRLAKNEYELMKKMLEDKSIEAKKFIDDYLICMRDINNDKLIEYIGDIQAEKECDCIV